jgi:hypothetical protein
MSDWLDASHGYTEQYMYEVTLSPDIKTLMDEILYISDMLMDKVYNYIKYGFDILYIHPNNLNKWTFSD